MRWLALIGLSLLLLGGSMVVGVFQPFTGSSTSTCIGALVGPICFGYWTNSTVVNGNNFTFGLLILGIGLVVFIIGVAKRGRYE